MQPTVGEIFEGKVTGITKFGAFVSLPDGKNGLVHISEIANTYVNDVHEHVTDGQTVKVKVISINDMGKINLSIKQTEEPVPRPEGDRPRQFQPRPQGTAPRQAGFQPRPSSFAPKPQPAPQTADENFEDKLKQFMQDADSRMSDNRIYADKKASYRRRRD